MNQNQREILEKLLDEIDKQKAVLEMTAANSTIVTPSKKKRR